MSNISNELVMEMFHQIARAKAFNGRFVDLKRDGKVSGPIHQTEGQEAVGVGYALALGKDDYIADYYRGMAGWIARGMNLKQLSAELLGREPGLCGGKGGEMTLADPSIGLVTSSGIIGGSIPSGVGAAISAKQNGKGQVAAVLFGDGAVNTGAFHEGVNLAAALKVPAIFICLNNQYGISTYIGDTLAGGSVAARGAAYGIPGIEVDGQDVVAVYQVVSDAIERARQGEGSTLIDAITFRIGGHSSTNPEIDFMDQEKLADFRRRDPHILLRQRILQQDIATEADLDRIIKDAFEEADEAVAFGLNAPYPASEAAFSGVFS